MAKTQKKDLVTTVARRSQLPEGEVVKVIDYFLSEMTKNLIAKETIIIPELGTFATKVSKARTGRNPRTGEALQIPAKTVPVFIPNKLFKEQFAN